MQITEVGGMFFLLLLPPPPRILSPCKTFIFYLKKIITKSHTSLHTLAHRTMVPQALTGLQHEGDRENSLVIICNLYKEKLSDDAVQGEADPEEVRHRHYQYASPSPSVCVTLYITRHITWRTPSLTLDTVCLISNLPPPSVVSW